MSELIIDGIELKDDEALVKFSKEYSFSLLCQNDLDRYKYLYCTVLDSRIDYIEEEEDLIVETSDKYTFLRVDESALPEIKLVVIDNRDLNPYVGLAIINRANIIGFPYMLENRE